MGLLYRIIGDFFSYIGDIGDIGDTIMAVVQKTEKKPSYISAHFKRRFGAFIIFLSRSLGPFIFRHGRCEVHVYPRCAALQGCIKCYGPKIRPKCFRGELALFSFALGPKTRSFSILCTPATTHNEYLKQKDFYRIFHHCRAAPFMF